MDPQPQTAAAEIHDAVRGLNAKAGDKALELLPPGLLEIDALLVAVKIAPQRTMRLAAVDDRLEFVDIVIREAVPRVLALVGFEIHLHLPSRPVPPGRRHYC